MADLPQIDLINRYQQAGHALLRHMKTADAMSAKFGMAYLSEFLAEDIAAELKLRDAFDDVHAELAAELGRVDVIAWQDGCYKVDANGHPCYFRVAAVEAKV